MLTVPLRSFTLGLRQATEKMPVKNPSDNGDIRPVIRNASHLPTEGDRVHFSLPYMRDSHSRMCSAVPSLSCRAGILLPLIAVQHISLYRTFFICPLFFYFSAK